MTLPSIRPLLGVNRIVPVLTIEDARTAVPIARALAAGGVTVIEVTLRTPAALEAMRLMAKECPEVVLGAGTILEPAQIGASIQAGARFLVTPGTTPALREGLRQAGVACLPGAASLTEMLVLREAGFTELKFFPAEASGGVEMLRSVGGPVGDLRFCPTGGVGPKNAATYLGLANVLCVGGSWLTPPSMVAAGDFAGITSLAREAVAVFGAAPR